MAGFGEVDWATCGDGCMGVRLPTGGLCWAHATDEHFDAAREQFATDGKLIASGVTFSAELLSRIFAHKGRKLLAQERRRVSVDFRNATFTDDVYLLGADGPAHFENAEFRGSVRFHGKFGSTAFFEGVTVNGHADFSGATFEGGARFLATRIGTATFTRATFKHDADFRRALFNSAHFVETTFERDVRFDNVTFSGPADFTETDFDRKTSFHDATFEKAVSFYKARFTGDALFSQVTFHQARQLGPMLLGGRLALDGAIFHQAVMIKAAANVVDCQRARFLGGVQLQLPGAKVELDDADLAAPSLLRSAPFLVDYFDVELEGRFRTGPKDPGKTLTSIDDEADYSFPEQDPHKPVPEVREANEADYLNARPRLVSIRRADVAGLTVAGVDMRACRFAGAHNLDQLKMSDVEFAATPHNWRWTARQTIAEEHNLRTESGWNGSDVQPPDWFDLSDAYEARRPGPAQIAAIYRSLRKGREDHKDEPGAADFYYGEMEMRRLDGGTPPAERAVLFLYWLFSGYGLRASRALLWLLGVLAVAALLLAATGLAESAATWSFPRRLGTAALVALEGAMFRSTDQHLTYTGRLVQIGLRFTGPILLGLAALSIRGRVKR